MEQKRSVRLNCQPWRLTPPECDQFEQGTQSLKLLSFTISLVCVFVASSAHALNCETAIATPDVSECAKQEQMVVEEKLNRVYQKALKHLNELDAEQDSKSKQKLIQAQRTWVKFRDADCDAMYTQYEGGTIRSIVYIDCMQKHAERRVEDLEAIYEEH